MASDWTRIRGNTRKEITDQVWEKDFNTPGRATNQSAMLMFMVRGLTMAKDNVTVCINNEEVGEIRHYKDGDPLHWHTQFLNFEGDRLKDGEPNEIQIDAPAGVVFFIRNVVCFFHTAD